MLRLSVVATMDDDDDLWGPPLVVQDDTLRKPLRGCEFWFDFRTDVLEENSQNERYCELVWRILNEKKQVAVVDEHDKNVASSGSADPRHVCSSDSDKTLSATLPDADTSSAKSSLDEDENTSSISDAQTVGTKDSTNDTEEIDPLTRLKPQEAAATDPITVEVAEDGDTFSSPVLASKIEEAEEHSCSSLVTHQVFDPIKQAPEIKSPSAISQENNGSSTLTALVLETREKVREKATATNEDGEILKDQQQSDSFQDIETASELFTTESLLEMCEEPEKGRETSYDEKSKRSKPEAVETVVKDELIINILTEARIKAEGKPLLNPGSVLVKKRKRNSNSSNNKGMNTSFIRKTKQKVGGEAGEISTDLVKIPTQSKPKIIKGSSIPAQLSVSTLDLIDRIRQRGGKTMGEPVISISELNEKTGKELRSIAKELKIIHYYKLKKEDLLQHCIRQLKILLNGCTEQRMES